MRKSYIPSKNLSSLFKLFSVLFFLCAFSAKTLGKDNITNHPPLTTIKAFNINTAVNNLDIYSDEIDFEAEYLEFYQKNPGINLAFKILTQGKYGKLSVNWTGNQIYELTSPRFVGVDTATYQVCTSDGVCDTALILINVININTAPIAYDDIYNSFEKEPVTGDVSENDEDLEFNIASFKLLTTPKLGKMQFSYIGVFTYTPTSPNLGVDTMSYRICDELGLCDTGKIIIKLAENTAPIAQDDYYETRGAEIKKNVGENDLDLNDNISHFKLLTDAQFGTLEMDTLGWLSYKPQTDVKGVDAIIYQVCDTRKLCDTAIIFITVNTETTPTIAPIAQDTTYEGVQNTPISGSLADLVWDTDKANKTYTYTVGPPLNGSLIVSQNGNFTYTPNSGFYGQDGFPYIVCTNFGLCDTAIVTLDIVKINQATTSAKADFKIKMNNTLMIASVNNGTVPRNTGTVTHTVVQPPVNGFGKILENGQIFYTPKHNFIGRDTFGYKTCDERGDCSTTIVAITIQGGFIMGKIYLDDNNNGAYDEGEVIMPNELLTVNDNTKYFSNTTGEFQVAADVTSEYVIKPVLNNALWTVSPLSKTVTTGSNSDQLIVNQDFAVKANQDINDLAINVEAGKARPGYTSTTTITYSNMGTKVLDGKVVLTLDKALTLQSSDVAPAQQNGNIITWDIMNLKPFESRNINVLVKTNTDAPLSSTVSYKYEGITPDATDTDLSNNKGTVMMDVKSVFEANEINVDRTEYIRKGDDNSTPSLPLTYTVRFQNTGKTQATRVVILDTLYEKLDLTALEMVAASHNFDIEIVPALGNFTVVKWIFDNINLMNTTANEALSCGFITFKVKNVSNKTNYVNDNIINKAAIYFDFDEPVFTNTVETKFSTLTVSSIKQFDLAFKAYPNPTKGFVTIELAKEDNAVIEIYNNIGQFMAREILKGQSGQIDMTNYQTGLYIINVKTATGLGMIKVLKD